MTTLNKKNLWILTEEFPSKEIIEVIFNQLNNDKKIVFFASLIRIIPILKNKEFTFTYQVIGIDCEGNSSVKIHKLYLGTQVSLII